MSKQARDYWMGKRYVVERPTLARAGKRAYVLDNGITSDINKATRMSLEYAQAEARIHERASGVKSPIYEMDTWGSAVLAVGAL